MSDSNPVPQADLKQLVAALRNSNPAKAILAAIVALIALLSPFVTISTNLGMGLDQSGYLNGFDAASGVAWLTLVIFVLAAAAWYVGQLAPYRLILAGATIVATLLAIIVGLYFNPVAGQLNDVNAAMAQLGAGNAISITPNIGMAILLLAALVSGLVAWKAR